VDGLRAAGRRVDAADFFSAVPPRAVVARRVGALALVSTSAVCGATDSRCSRDIKRDLRRAAALRCTMPYCAA
jgi:hypothetical protein